MLRELAYRMPGPVFKAIRAVYRAIRALCRLPFWAWRLIGYHSAHVLATCLSLGPTRSFCREKTSCSLRSGSHITISRASHTSFSMTTQVQREDPAPVRTTPLSNMERRADTEFPTARQFCFRRSRSTRRSLGYSPRFRAFRSSAGLRGTKTARLPMNKKRHRMTHWQDSARPSTGWYSWTWTSFWSPVKPSRNCVAGWNRGGSTADSWPRGLWRRATITSTGLPSRTTWRTVIPIRSRQNTSVTLEESVMRESTASSLTVARSCSRLSACTSYITRCPAFTPTCQAGSSLLIPALIRILLESHRTRVGTRGGPEWRLKVVNPDWRRSDGAGRSVVAPGTRQ